MDRSAKDDGSDQKKARAAAAVAIGTPGTELVVSF